MGSKAGFFSPSVLGAFAPPAPHCQPWFLTSPVSRRGKWEEKGAGEFSLDMGGTISEPSLSDHSHHLTNGTKRRIAQGPPESIFFPVPSQCLLCYFDLPTELKFINGVVCVCPGWGGTRGHQLG